MAGYIGSKAVLLSTTAATVTGNSTIGGNLTVDTDTLFVDAANNRVGIGTTSVDGVLSVDGSMYAGPGSVSGVAYGFYPSSSYGNTGMFSPAANTVAFATTGGERARIDASGNLLVGKTSASATLDVKTASNQQVCRISLDAASSLATPALVLAKKDNNTTTSQVFAQFLVNSEGTGAGQINANGGGAAAFGSYSDERLKENISDLPPQLDSIMALRPVEFDYIASEGGGHQTGFIAQEMQQVYPDAVGERSPDGMLTVTGWGKTEARLVKALQEALTKIEALEARMAILEGGAA